MTFIACRCVFKIIHKITPYPSNAWEVKAGLTTGWANVAINELFYLHQQLTTEH